MATKVGILSDEHYKKNCFDYASLPVGFANAEFRSGMSNPYLPGIKTPKYQRSAPKPMSADVAAVSAARTMPGNTAANARMILNEYQQMAKDFKPPPVNLVTQMRPIETQAQADRERLSMSTQTENNRGKTTSRLQDWEERYSQAVSAVPRVGGQTRGELLIKQTIGQDADPTVNANRLMMAYSSKTRAQKLEIGAKLGALFIQEGISGTAYDIYPSVLKGRAIQGREVRFTDEGGEVITRRIPFQSADDASRVAMIMRGLSTLEMRQSNANLDEIFGILSPVNIGAGSSTDPLPSAQSEMSAPTTDYLPIQGIAETTTVSTTPETVKK